MSQKHFPRETHAGVLRIAEAGFPCTVLEDGARLLTRKGFSRTLGRNRIPVSLDRLDPEGDQESPDQRKIVPFASAKNLQPFVEQVFRENDPLWDPIEFITRKGSKTLGYRAELLPKICKVYLLAKRAGALTARQLHLAERCETILFAFAEVGIIALVDEATGYQAHRPKDALQQLLNRLLAREPLPAERVIAQGFFDEVVRVWQVHPQCPGLAQVFNNLVYRRLAPGLLPELKERNSDRYANGKLKKRHTQWLADPEGRHAIIRHVETVSLVLKSSQDRADAYQLLDRLLPVQRDDLLLPDGGQY